MGLESPEINAASGWMTSSRKQECDEYEVLFPLMLRKNIDSIFWFKLKNLLDWFRKEGDSWTTLSLWKKDCIASEFWIKNSAFHESE